ncbi:MAG: SDR family oxidoreductase [Actinobacteria bacterium]|nr:SDR family oxidoreductase [Actinomycetota bacterium]
MRGLDGMSVLVTGAGRGIGLAVTERLAEEGAHVAAADLNEPVECAGAKARLSGDVTSEEDVARVFDDAWDALNGVDALVLCAGIHWVGPTHEMRAEDFDRVLAVSARGTFLFCRAALPRMVDRGSGHILTFGSTAAVAGAPGLTAYAAAKGAVLQITRSIAAEYAPLGIRANCLCPGATDTPLLRELMAGRADAQGFRDAHPIGRFAQPAEIAGAAAWLLSEDASFMVGAAVMCDGGFTTV